MSFRAVPRRTHLSSSTPRDAKNPSRVLQHTRFVVGIRTEVSYGNEPGTTSFFAEWSSSLVLFHRAGFAPCPPRQAVSLAGSSCAGQIRSAMPHLRRSSYNPTAGRFSHNLLSFNDFSLGVRSKPLTRGCFERNIAPHRGRSRCVASAEIPSGCVPGPLTKSGEA